MPTLHDFTATSIDGREVDLASYAGQVVLVVNTASRCGLTPQYAGLQRLHQDYADRGFTVLGFPCDQFLHQEPGTEAEIAEFCEVNYGVTFPMFAKVEVNGEGAHPLWAWLTGPHGEIPGGDVEWNFGKFLVGPTGPCSSATRPPWSPSSSPATWRRLSAERRPTEAPTEAAHRPARRDRRTGEGPRHECHGPSCPRPGSGSDPARSRRHRGG